MDPRRLVAVGRPFSRAPGRRRSLAVVACALWVLSFEAVPNFHIGFHNLLPHHHHHDHGHGEAKHSDSGHDKDRPDHGAKSFEHRGVAILDGPPPLVVVAITTFEFVAKLEKIDELVELRRPQSIRVRGPPLLS